MTVQTTPAPLPAPTFAHVEARAVAALLAEQAPVLLLDVREDWEYAQGHLPGAQHLPLSGMPASLAELPAERSRRIVTYCHHGMRSQKAAAMLLTAGFANVSSMDGGIDAWATDVDQSVGRY